MSVRWYHWAVALIAGSAMHTAVFANIAWHKPTLIARSAGPQVIVFGQATDSAPAKTAPAKTAAVTKTEKPKAKTAPAEPEKPRIAVVPVPEKLKPAPAKTAPAETAPAETAALPEPVDAPAPATLKAAALPEPVEARPAATPKAAALPEPAPLQRVQPPPAPKPALKPPRQTTDKPKKTRKAEKTRKAAKARAAQRRGVARARRIARLRTGSAKPRAGSSLGNAALTNYRGQVLAHLRRFKRYPEQARWAGRQGTAILLFTLASSGKLAAFSMVKPSGHALLDKEVLRMIKAATPFPKIPPKLKRRRMRFRVPVRFRLD